jgi:hypothetical protein
MALPPRILTLPRRNRSIVDLRQDLGKRRHGAPVRTPD